MDGTDKMEKTIDLEKVLSAKLGKKMRWVPRPLLGWLRRIMHEDEVNTFLWDNRDKTGTPWLEACVEFLDMRLELVGTENLPAKDDGRLYTFVSNHPLGGIDGVALGSIIGRHYDGKFRYLVRDELMFLPGLAPLCIGINKTGRQSRTFPARIEAGFTSDNHMLMFPAGICSRRMGGTIHDLAWTKTFVAKSIEYGRDIVPIHFGGENSPRFYRVANACKRLGLKVNIAQLFLVDEMFRNKHKTFRIAFGKPIPWQTLDKSRTHKQWAQHIEDIVYTL